MSFTAATGAPVCYSNGDGFTLEFRKLTRGEIGKLSARWIAEDRARLHKSLAEAGADAATRTDKLLEFDERTRYFGYGLVCLTSWDRTMESLKVSRDGVEEDADNWPIGREELLEIAAATWGWKEPEEDEPAGSPKAGT